MSFEDFKKLGLDHKANFAWSKGIFLDNYVDRDKTTNLYHYRRFYIEIKVSHQGGKILEVVGFRGMRRLDKYLRKIELHELI